MSPRSLLKGQGKVDSVNSEHYLNTLLPISDRLLMEQSNSLEEVSDLHK